MVTLLDQHSDMSSNPTWELGYLNSINSGIKSALVNNSVRESTGQLSNQSKTEWAGKTQQDRLYLWSNAGIV